ncbi:MAG: hypothetical protein V4584_01410 [Verrucomicrobiota bacterium]
MTLNPYEAPLVRDVTETAPSEAETIRKQHIKHEASLKSVGLLYWLGGAITIIAGAVPLLGGTGGSTTAHQLGAASFFVVFGIFQIGVGIAIRRLRRWTLLPVGILSALGLAAIPVGTIISAYILYLFFGGKGKVVLSDSYKQVIAATPHIRYKTSKVIWVLLGLVVLLILAGVVALAMRK